MFTLETLLRMAKEVDASDIHLSAGCPVMARVDGYLNCIIQEKCTQQNLEQFARTLMSENQSKEFANRSQLDFSYGLPGVGRCRINVFRQRGSIGFVIHFIPFDVPDLRSLKLPMEISSFTTLKKGLVLVAGTAGSGKSTTLAALISEINQNRVCNILTIEDPIEYLHHHQKSIVNQREIGSDVLSVSDALLAIVHQDPDIIFLNEISNATIMSKVLNLIELGYLVFSSLPTHSVIQSIQYMVELYPPEQQPQIRAQLAANLEGIVAQQLHPKRGGNGRAVATETLVTTNAIRDLIRDGHFKNISNILKANKQTMEDAIQELVKNEVI